MIHIKPSYSLKIFCRENGKPPYIEWLKSLDKANHRRISLRIARFSDGFFGDHKAVGSGVFEARFFFGSGYRVYFSIVRTEIILLLLGGDKDNQRNDIEIAKEFLEIYLENENANKKC